MREKCLIRSSRHFAFHLAKSAVVVATSLCLQSWICYFSVLPTSCLRAAVNFATLYPDWLCSVPASIPGWLHFTKWLNRRTIDTYKECSLSKWEFNLRMKWRFRCFIVMVSYVVKKREKERDKENNKGRSPEQPPRSCQGSMEAMQGAIIVSCDVVQWLPCATGLVNGPDCVSVLLEPPPGFLSPFPIPRDTPSAARHTGPFYFPPSLPCWIFLFLQLLPNSLYLLVAIKKGEKGTLICETLLK